MVQYLRVRSLMSWSMVALIASIGITAILESLLGTSIDPIFGVLFSLVSVPWLILKLRNNPEMFQSILGKKTFKISWVWVYPIIACIVFSLGAFALIWLPLSFIVPEFVLQWIQDDSFFTEDGNPLPISGHLLNFLSIVILAPIFEEIFFRGIILRRWSYKFGPKQGILFSSLLFGFLHPDVIGATVGGIILGLLYLKFSSLYVPIMAHCLNNALAYGGGFLFFLFEEPTPVTISSFQTESPYYLLFLIPGVILLYLSTKGLRSYYGKFFEGDEQVFKNVSDFENKNDLLIN